MVQALCFCERLRFLFSPSLLSLISKFSRSPMKFSFMHDFFERSLSYSCPGVDWSEIMSAAVFQYIHDLGSIFRIKHWDVVIHGAWQVFMDVHKPECNFPNPLLWPVKVYVVL